MDAAAGRLAPLEPADWDPSLADVLDRLAPPLNIHNVIARNPSLMLSYSGLRDHVVGNSSIDPRCRELVILRVAHCTSCAYEWDHHVVRAREAGLSDADIARVRAGVGADGWTPVQSLLLMAVDDMLGTTEIARTTWAGLCEEFDDCQLLDILFTIGIYAIMSTILRTARVPREPGFRLDDPV